MITQKNFIAGSMPRKIRKKRKEVGKFCVYLIAPQSIEGKFRPYIGCTNNPSRRIRQHNGEISGGAIRTRGVKWRFILIVSGFVNRRDALQFEWQSQKQAKVYGANVIWNRRKRKKVSPLNNNGVVIPDGLRNYIQIKKSKYTLGDMIQKNTAIMTWLLTWYRWTNNGLLNKKRKKELNVWWMDSSYMPNFEDLLYFPQCRVEHIDVTDIKNEILKEIGSDSDENGERKEEEGIIDLTIEIGCTEKNREISECFVSLFSDSDNEEEDQVVNTRSPSVIVIE